MSGFRHGEILDHHSCGGVMRAEPHPKAPGYLALSAHDEAVEQITSCIVGVAEARKLGGYLRDWADYQEGRHEQPKDLG